MPLWLLTWISLKIFNLFIQKGDKLCSKLLFFVQKVLQYFSERKSIAIVQYFSFKKVLQYFCNTRKKYCNIALQYCNIAILRVWFPQCLKWDFIKSEVSLSVQNSRIPVIRTSRNRNSILSCTFVVHSISSTGIQYSIKFLHSQL